MEAGEVHHLATTFLLADGAEREGGGDSEPRPI